MMNNPPMPSVAPPTAGPRRAPSTADKVLSMRMTQGLDKTVITTSIPPRAPFHLPPMTAPPYRPSNNFPNHRQTFLKPQEPLSYFSARLTCPYCYRPVQTKTVSSDSCMAIFLSSTLCILGCWCCVCLPFCLESLQKVEHSCPKCKMVIGTYNPGL